MIFSGGGGLKNFMGGEILGGGKKIKKITPPFLIYTPGFEQKNLRDIWWNFKRSSYARHAQCFGILKKLTFKQEELTVHFFTMQNLVILLLT